MIGAPYQPGSDTSREAAETVVSRGSSNRDRAAALSFIEKNGPHGATIDEIAVHLTAINQYEVVPGTASARVSELLDQKLICKTPLRRKTRRGSSACVHVAGSSWVDVIGVQEQPTSPAPVVHKNQATLDKTRADQAAWGHGHVVLRNDGKKDSCGGPRICRTCNQVKRYIAFLEEGCQ